MRKLRDYEHHDFHPVTWNLWESSAHPVGSNDFSAGGPPENLGMFRTDQLTDQDAAVPVFWPRTFHRGFGMDFGWWQWTLVHVVPWIPFGALSWQSSELRALPFEEWNAGASEWPVNKRGGPIIMWGFPWMGYPHSWIVSNGKSH